MPARLIITAVAVALLVAGGVAAVDLGVAETGQQESVSESFTPPTTSGTTVLNQSQLDGVRYFPVENITVTDENGTLMVPSEDFAWDRPNGTVETLAGGRLAGDSSANIEYGYRLTSDTAEGIGGLAGSGFETAGTLMFVVVVGFVVVSLRAFEVI